MLARRWGTEDAASRTLAPKHEALLSGGGGLSDDIRDVTTAQRAAAAAAAGGRPQPRHGLARWVRALEKVRQSCNFALGMQASEC